MATLTELAATPDPEFFDKALCPQTDPEIFFPEKGESNAEAKSVCDRCEVRRSCLQWALDNEIKFGVWGGLSANERRTFLAGRLITNRMTLRRLEGIHRPTIAADTQRLAG